MLRFPGVVVIKIGCFTVPHAFFMTFCHSILLEGRALNGDVIDIKTRLIADVVSLENKL